MNRIIAACPAGLGNRIKCMVSTIKRCSEIKDKGEDASAHVYWPINDECGCSFEELFESSSSLQEMGRSELYTVEVDTHHNDSYINKSWKLDANTDKSDASSDIDFKYHKLSQDKIIEFLPYFWHIRPKKDIRDTAWAFVNRYKESFNKCEVIGVHIRKGDYKKTYDGRGKISKEEDFVERMRCLLEVNPNYKFLLCTEDEETEERFRLRFGSNHIIYFPKRFRGRCTPESIKEAFVDILLLARCPIIIGTFLSTFTELAWWGGNCRAQVVIPGAENREAVDEVLAKLPQEGEGIYRKILRRIRIWMREI